MKCKKYLLIIKILAVKKSIAGKDAAIDVGVEWYAGISILREQD